jgi:GDP-L-fucose synthase
MTEGDVFKGKAPAGNFAYAMAKRTLLTRIESYNKQYGLSWNWVAPCNLYGEYDKFEDHHSHFIPALLKKIYYATDKINIQ